MSDEECPNCGQSFSTERRLKRHMKTAHGTSPTSSKRKLAYAGVALVLVGVVAGLLLTGGGGAETKTQALEDLGATDDPSLGNSSAPIAVVAFETPRCPSCRAFHERMQPDIKSKYLDTGQAVLYYQQFSIGYGYDEPGGIAQECVFEHEGDDAFWTFTDVLYAQQGQWTSANTADRLQSLAESEGWDTGPLVSCYENRETQSAYDADVQAGRDNGVSGTPTFFVVGHDGETTLVSAGELDQTIEKEYQRAQEA